MSSNNQQKVAWETNLLLFNISGGLEFFFFRNHNKVLLGRFKNKRSANIVAAFKIYRHCMIENLLSSIFLSGKKYSQ